jgi:hypothetical protein
MNQAELDMMNALFNQGAYSDPNYKAHTYPLTWSGAGGNAALPAHTPTFGQGVASATAGTNQTSADTSWLGYLMGYANIGASQQGNADAQLLKAITKKDAPASIPSSTLNKPMNTQAQDMAQGQAQASAAGGWFAGVAANWGLVAFGACLMLGALVISNKGTIIQLAKGAAV